MEAVFYRVVQKKLMSKYIIGEEHAGGEEPVIEEPEFEEATVLSKLNKAEL